MQKILVTLFTNDLHCAGTLAFNDGSDDYKFDVSAQVAENIKAAIPGPGKYLLAKIVGLSKHSCWYFFVLRRGRRNLNMSI